MFANTQMMGVDVGFPDVCTTAPSTTGQGASFPDVALAPSPNGSVPIPYPNVGASSGPIGGMVGGLLGGMNPLTYLSMLGGGEPEANQGITPVPSQSKVLMLAP